ncbi:MAG: hypothetical protein WC250_00905 [Candidatus Paceibacterota bacterium]|jgi:hypothetical protein
MKTLESQTSKGSESLAESKAELLKMVAELEATRTNPIDFRGVAGCEDVDIIKDVKAVQEKEAAIATKVSELRGTEKDIYEDSKLVESLLCTCIRESNWLGEDAEVILASLYDDYFRGIDTIAELKGTEPEGRHVGFSIDFTMSPDTIATKLTKTVESIAKGFTPSVKYFNSPSMGKFRNFKMAKVVLGADYPSVKRLADAYVEAHASGKPISEVLVNDPIQFVLLDEIRGQLQALRNIAYEQFNNRQAGAIYHKTLMTFMGVMAKRGITEEMMRSKSRGDTMHSRILSMIGKFDREAKR